MDDYGKFITKDWVTEEEVLRAMWESNGSRSHLKGTAVEQSFRKLVKLQGWISEKIPDSDKSRRYDFIVWTATKCLRVEVKNLLPGKTLALGFRDYRHLKLPSGQELKTKCRTINDDFDFLAVCLANYTSIKDFVFIKFGDIPHYKPKFPDKNDWLNRKFPEDFEKVRLDEVWKQQNLLASSIHVPTYGIGSPFFGDIRAVVD